MIQEDCSDASAAAQDGGGGGGGGGRREEGGGREMDVQSGERGRAGGRNTRAKAWHTLRVQRPGYGFGYGFTFEQSLGKLEVQEKLPFLFLFW